MKVTTPTVPSSESCRETKRRRSEEISKIRERLSMGDSEVQRADEMKCLSKEERDSIMKEANFHISVPPEQGLAMKADLCLSWNKLRIMRRF